MKVYLLSLSVIAVTTYYVIMAAVSSILPIIL